MIFDKPILFLEINKNNIIIFSGKYNENFDFEILFKDIFNLSNFKLGVPDNSKDFFENIKNAIFLAEKKINFTFKNLILILDSPEIFCVNVSGSKKINKSQINEDDITFILNDLKKTVQESYKRSSIIHLFNTNFILDNKKFDNPPVGLIGDRYFHEISLFLLPSNDLKNISSSFKKLNLTVDRILFKNFLEGMEKMHNSSKKDFFKINLNKESCDLSFFDNSSFVFYENFKFGSNKFKQDVSKVCSLSNESVDQIFKTISFNGVIKKKSDMLLDKSMFKDNSFRKISLNHIFEIIDARNTEIFNLIFNKNTNILNLKKHTDNIFIEVEDESIFNNQAEMIKKNFDHTFNVSLKHKTHNDQYLNCSFAAELISKGWDREVIAYTQDKKSLISRIFSKIF